MKKCANKYIMIILIFIIAISFCNRSFAATLEELRKKADAACEEAMGEVGWLKKCEDALLEACRRDDAINELKKSGIEPTEANIAEKRRELMEKFITEDDGGPHINLKDEKTDELEDYIKAFSEDMKHNFNEVRDLINKTEEEYGNERLPKMNAYLDRASEIEKQVTSKLGENDPKRLLWNEVLTLASEENVHIAQGDGGEDKNGNKIELNEDEVDKATKRYGDLSGRAATNVPIYHSPERTSSDRQQTEGDILEEIIGNSEKFAQSGNNNAIDNERFKYIMSYIYNMFFQVGIVAAVIIAAVLGIKFMLSSLDQKAEVKKMLGVYVIACVVIFGSFGIWKLVLTILDQM